jgi:hypothetical protein
MTVSKNQTQLNKMILDTAAKQSDLIKPAFSAHRSRHEERIKNSRDKP